MSRGIKKQPSPILEALRDACTDEAMAVAFLEAHRWGEVPCCARCASTAVYKMRDAKTGARNKDWRWRCKDCKAMYTVRTGSTLEETRLPLRVWCFALWSACSSKKGVSAMQISRECEISYKSALFLMHRVRASMAPKTPPALTGTVEADETFIGGKPRYKGPHNKRGPANKIAVFGVVQRDGDLRLRALERLDSESIAKALREHVHRSARLMTDESGAYTKIGRSFAGGHHKVSHKLKEYSRNNGDVTTNTIEGAFSLLKRGVFGTFHSISRKHLHRYLAEFEFRYNARKIDDGQRIARAVRAAVGKRLTYKDQLAGVGG